MIKWLLRILIIGISLYVAIIEIIYVSKDMYKVGDIKDIDYIVILGSKVEEDGRPGYLLKDRLDVAYDFTQQTDAPIIVSGGKGSDEPISEAQAMKNYLVEKGVDPKRIIKEDKSTSTLENLKNTKAKIVGDESQLLLVTTNFHVFRVHMLARRLNLNVYIEGANTPIRVRNIIREPIAIVKSFLFDW